MKPAYLSLRGAKGLRGDALGHHLPIFAAGLLWILVLGLLKLRGLWLGVVGHSFYPSTWKAEGGKSL